MKEPFVEAPKLWSRGRGRLSEARFELLLAAVLLFLVGVAGLLRLSGSSIASYERIFEGASADGDDLVFGQPRGIRSDEWLRWTPLVVSQARSGYPAVNQDLRDGIDLTIIDDLPHRSWTAAFEPQHVAFWVQPDVEVAFAFKWYWMAAYAFFSVVVFARRVGSLPVGASLLVGGLWAASPMFHWWYHGHVWLPVSHALIAMTLFHAAMTSTTLRGRTALGALIGYFATAALVVQYPPFVIGAAVPAAVFCFLLVAQRARDTTWRESLVTIGPSIATAVIVIAGFAIAFVIDKGELIQLVMDSEHPGNRSYESGQADLSYAAHLLSSNLAPNLLSDQRSTNYFTNQSEASNVIFFLPFLVLSGGLIEILRHRKGLPADRISIGLIALSAAEALWLFVPSMTWAFSPFFFTSIPLFRSVMFLGFTQLLLLVRILQVLHRTPGSLLPRWFPLAAMGLVAVVTVLANRLIIEENPGFVGGRVPLAASTAALALGVGLLFAATQRPRLAGLSLLVVLSLWSSITINPVHRGLGVLQDTSIVRAIERIDAADPTGTWVVNGSFVFENLAVQAGVPSISGSAPHTQAPYWEEVFPWADETVYDRAAHFEFSLVDTEEAMTLRAVNFVDVRLDPCGTTAERARLRHVVSTTPLDRPCLSLLETVDYPAITFFIYQRNDG